ncbi:MAG: segregation and condensation protein A [Armatimonadota bacterium]
MITAQFTASLTEEQLTRFTGYPVSLPVFEGPLDLLLYLIRRQEIDIYDIPIAKITGQFLSYMTLMESLDVELAADFLVMAASLLEIKSRMLLPRPPVVVEEEDVIEEDPRMELVRRLLEYQQFKSAAGELNKRAEEHKRLFARTDIVPNLAFLRPEPSLAGDPDAFALWMALQEVLARVEEAGPQVREVARPQVTIRKQMMHILKMLETNLEGVKFSDLFFFEGRERMLTRIEVIVTFLAMLELIRLHRVAIKQRDLFGEIKLQLVTATAERVN